MKVSPLHVSWRSYRYYLEGRLHAMGQRRKKAIRSFKMALVYDTYSPFLYVCIAKQYFQGKNWPRAIFWARKALKIKKTYAPAHHLLGQIYWRQKKRRLAIKEYRLALRKDPTLKQAYLDLYQALRESGQPKRQIRRLLQEMIRSLPTAYKGYYLLGNYYFTQKKIRRAIHYFRQTLNYHPSHVQAMYRLGHAYLRQKNYNKAIRAFRDLLDYRPGAWMVRLELAVLFLRRKNPDDHHLAAYQFRTITRDARRPAARAYSIGQKLYKERLYQQAVKWFRRAISQKSDLYLAQYYLGLSLKQLGQVDRAVAALREIPLTQRELYRYARQQIIQALGKAGRYREAHQELRESRRKLNDAKSWLELSRALSPHARKQDLKREIYSLRRALRRWPQHQGLLFQLGHLYLKIGEEQKSLRQMRRLLRLNKQHADAMNFIGYHYAEKGIQLEKAARLIRRALQLRPNTGYFLDSLGWVYFRQGKYQSARRTLERAVEMHPHEATILAHLGEVYLRLGQYRRALSLFLRARRQKPEPNLARSLEKQIQTLRQKLAEGGKNKAAAPSPRP